MKPVSNDFKIKVNEFGRQLDTNIDVYENIQDNYEVVKGNLTQNGSPSPSNPINIETITGNQTITIGSKTYSISLGNIELCKLGEYQDYIYKNNDNWYIHKEIGKIILDGSEEWLQAGTQYTGLYSAYINFAEMKRQSIYSGDIYSNYFTEKSFNVHEEAITKSSRPLEFDTLIVRLSTDKANDINTLKNWISNHNTTVYYVLATTEEVQITDTALISQLNAIKIIKESLTRDNIYKINPNFHTNIMETLMKCMTIETDTLIQNGEKVHIQSGIKIGNNYEYVDYGYYTVKEYTENKNKGSYTMKCYDDMLLTMVDYDLQVTYPITVKNLLTAICNHFGFTLNTQSFVNDSSLIEKDLFSNLNLTYRDVLSELAIATASIIEIENGIMYVKYPTNTNLVIDEDILNDTNIEISKKYGPVNRLIITKTGDVDPEVKEDTSSISQNGLTELKISDKQIFSDETTRDNLMTNMFNSIKGFEYYICNLNTQGLMYLEALDKFNVSINNVIYPTIAINDETNIDNGLDEKIYQEEPLVSESEYKYTKSEDKKIANAQIDIDKANAQIILKANSQGKIVQVELKADADTGSTFNIDADNINLTATDVLNILAGNSINLTSKNITIDSTNFSVDANGNMTCGNANITGGEITLNSTEQSPMFTITDNIQNTITKITGTGSVSLYNNDEYLTLGAASSSLYGVLGHINLLSTNGSIETRIFANQILIMNNNTNNTTEITDEYIITNKINAGNIDCGINSLTSNWTTIYFNKTFANPPTVVLTPNTNTNGVIAGKVRNVTTTGFEAAIGGSFSGTVNFNWIAIDNQIS